MNQHLRRASRRRGLRALSLGTRAAAVAAVAAVAALGGSTIVSSAAATTSGAVLSKPLSTWLAAAPADATFETIVTFGDRSGMSRLDGLGVGGTRLSELPIALTTLTAAQIRQVATWPEVRSLWHNQRMDLSLDESVALTGADKVWSGTGLRRTTGYTGAGVGVGVIDTGVDGSHPDLLGKVEGYAVQGDLFDEYDKDSVVVAPAPTGDTYGHGTHVASTIGGLGLGATGADGDLDGDADRFVGVAPGAKIFSYKTDTGVYLYGGPILVSFDEMLKHNRAVAEGRKVDVPIRVSSNSWGCCDGSNYDPDDPINIATKVLYDSDVTVVFAAGNGGGPNTIGTHSTSPWVISVAAGTKNDDPATKPVDPTLATFSSRGRCNGDEAPCMRDDPNTPGSEVEWNRATAQSANTGLYRPTLTAPGESIEAAKSSQATLMADGTDPLNPMYTYASGTSMATPHVAGAVALMLEARPTLKPQHVIDILEGTADNMAAYETFEAGTGHVDALEAVQAAEKGKVKFPPSTKGKTPEYVQTSRTEFGGTVATGTWLFRSCNTDGTIPAGLNQHKIDVASGTDVVYTEIEWDDPNQLIYLVLYDPQCNVVGESAALLDIGAVNHRALMATNPEPGTWTVGVYGRLNLPTQYTGAFSTFDGK